MSARVLLATLLAAAASACADAGPTAEIVERRTASRPSSPVRPGATTRQRFEMPEMRPPMEAASDDLLDYDLPEGWQVLAPTSERYVNLRPAGDAEAACYLSFLPGDAGGLPDNVNRWRGQLAAEPLTADAVAALPKHALLGRGATLVEVAGPFTGMGGGTPRPGFALLGLALCEPDGSLFLKFTGPATLVAAERGRFLAFASSLRPAEQHGPGDGHDHGESTNAGPQGADLQDTAREGLEPQSAAPKAAGIERSVAQGELAWRAPAGWVEQRPRSMRVVTFALGGDADAGAECYVTRLVGDAGGLRANLDRWSEQLGRGRLTDAQFEELATVEMLGETVPVLELDGDFTGMDGVKRTGQGLLGVACVRAQDSLFVKLTGPAALVRAERANFLAFVQSLEDAP